MRGEGWERGGRGEKGSSGVGVARRCGWVECGEVIECEVERVMGRVDRFGWSVVRGRWSRVECEVE